MHTIFTFLCLCLYTCFLYAQAPNHVPGELLFQLQPNSDATLLVQNKLEKKAQSAHSCIQAFVPVASALNIWKIKFDPNCIDETQLLNLLRQDPDVAFAQFNHYVELRGTSPNDPLFPQQWQWYNQGQNGGNRGLDIGLQQAWDSTTGGVTTRGDSIVVAIIDTGTDTNHEDLRPNLWRNTQEIPKNRIDDDRNGYIDDYHGWNVWRFNDDVSDDLNGSGHGTGIAGIIGAKGDNNIGISGVNWNVKLMTIGWGLGSTSEEIVLRGFNYIYTQRKLYNETGGKKGAYVVAINASWGVPRLRSADYPIWCPFFDSLGNQGILTINAAGKELEDTEEFGDMPSGCPSNYLMVVTNIDGRGKLRQGYGPNTVDLAAPAQGILSTRLREGFREFSGTSFAAPQVAGAIALLYASPCVQLADLARQSPAEAALLARRLILDGVEPIADLRGKVVTGGYLRVDKSLRLLSAYCYAEAQNSPQLLAHPNPFREQLLVPIRSTRAIENATLEVFNLQGQRMYSQPINISANFPGLVEIEANSWPQGMYILRLRWGGKEMVAQKVVKI